MFTKTQLETIEALLTEALGNRKRAEKAISKKEQAVFFQVQEIVSRGGNSRKYIPLTEAGNEYIDGTYRLWKREGGGISLKLDRAKQLYNLPKDTDLYDRIYDLFEFYGSPEIDELEHQRSQEINLDVMEEADDEYRGADQE
jgi:hypothetical protein